MKVEVEMLSEEELEHYRKMTPGEHLKLTFEVSKEHLRNLLLQPEEVVRDYLDTLNREKEESNRSLLEGLARSRDKRPPPSTE